jgi:predicted metalloprotease with PDZ domain
LRLGLAACKVELLLYGGRVPLDANLKPICFSLILTMSLAVSAVAGCGPEPASGRFLAYTVEPVIADGAVSLAVTVSFRLPGTKSARLVLPSEWQGQKELYKAIHDLEALSPGTVLQKSETPWLRQVTFPLGQVVRLRYRVTKDWGGKIDSSSYFRVMLDRFYFQVSGRNFLVYPDLPDDEVLRMSLEWKGLPPRWSIVDSLAGDATCQSVTARLIKLSNGLFAGGEFRTSKMMVKGEPVYFATRDRWEFADSSFSELAQKILAAEREFWNDTGIPTYLITLLPSDDTPGNYGGTALEDSFALFMSRTTTLDFNTKFLLAHEMFHSWNAVKLGEIKQETPYWFTEGFTDYYARLLLLRAGLISAEEYARDVDSRYYEYLSSPVLHVSGKREREQFFEDSNLQRLAYLRGDFLAHRWDQLIRQRSGGKESLDTAMRNLLQQARRHELVLTSDFLGSYFGSYVGPDGPQDVQKYIENGETIPLPSRRWSGPEEPQSQQTPSRPDSLINSAQ